jgi:ribosomal protein L12E/L44/L45/RPP1/RPP2
VRDLVKAAKARIINKKVGDEVELVDGADFLFVVTEIHDVQEPKQAPAPEAPAEAPQAAPAAEEPKAEEPKAEEKGPEAPEKN